MFVLYNGLQMTDKEFRGVSLYFFVTYIWDSTNMDDIHIARIIQLYLTSVLISRKRTKRVYRGFCIWIMAATSKFAEYIMPNWYFF